MLKFTFYRHYYFITHDETLIRALTLRVGWWVIFSLAQSSAIKQIVGVWRVQLRVLARCDVRVRANRNKEAVQSG